MSWKTGNMDTEGTMTDYKTKCVYKVLNYNWEADSRDFGTDVNKILYMGEVIKNPLDRFFFSQFFHKTNKKIKDRFFVLNMVGRPDATGKKWTGTAFIKMTGEVICSGDVDYHGYKFQVINNLDACVEIDEARDS